MRVDLPPIAPQPSDNSKTSRASQSPATSVSSGATREIDRTRFSFDQARLQSLEAAVMAQPEIRAQKVSSIQNLLATGRYHVSDGQIAQAMMSEWADGNSGK